jgi:hypothetical protein
MTTGWMTPKAYALAAGISRAAVWRMIRRGALEVSRDGPRDRVRVRPAGNTQIAAPREERPS